MMGFLEKEEKEKLILEYTQLHNEILERNHYGWFIISIFIAATFIVSFGTNDSSPLALRYFVSLALTLFSWGLHAYFVHVNNSCWRRRRDIEELLGMDGPRNRYDGLLKTFKYQVGKHIMWRALWVFLTTLYLVLFIKELGSVNWSAFESGFITLSLCTNVFVLADFRY